MKTFRHWLAGTLTVAAVAALGGGAPMAQTLTVANSAPAPALGLPSVTNRQTLYIMNALYDPLTEVDGSGEALPRLAQSWAVTADPTVWRFKLRPGVTFHDGSKMNADSIVAMVDYLASDEGRGVFTVVSRNIASVAGAQKVDDLTVDIMTKTPDAILPNVIASLYIIDMASYNDMGREKFSRAPVGTGSFRATAWSENEVALERYAAAFRPAKLDNLRILTMPELASRVQALASGQVDVALTLDKDDREAVESSGGSIFTEFAPSVNVIMLDMVKDGPLKDKRVRQALNYGLDKTFVPALHGETARLGGQPAARTARGYQADIAPYPYDPAKAKALLAEAGYPDGFKMIGEIQGNLSGKATYEYVANNLRNIGVELELRVITVSDLIARINGAKPFAGDVFGMNFGSAPIGDMMRSINSYHSCDHKPTWTCIPEIEPAIKAVNAEFDPVKRAAGLRQIALAYHENAPAIWLEETVSFHGVAKQVQGFRSENFLIPYNEISRAK